MGTVHGVTSCNSVRPAMQDCKRRPASAILLLPLIGPATFLARGTLISSQFLGCICLTLWLFVALYWLLVEVLIGHGSIKLLSRYAEFNDTSADVGAFRCAWPVSNDHSHG